MAKTTDVAPAVRAEQMVKAYGPVRAAALADARRRAARTSSYWGVVLDAIAEHEATAEGRRERDTIVARIAAEELNVETLETRNSDRLDFHDVSAAGLQRALRMAYDAGRAAK